MKNSRLLRNETGTGRLRAAAAIAIAAGMLTLAVPAPCQYEQIVSLDRSDPAFESQQESVRRFYRSHSLREEPPDLTIYSYVTRSDDTLFGVAARLSVPYSAIATLNRLVNSELGEEGQLLLLPSIPGVFVPLTPETDLELVMHDLRHEQSARVVSIDADAGNRAASTVFRFYPGEDFFAEERSTFLGLLFRPPLRVIDVSSGFGPRSHPVTGEWGFHAGVDLPAPTGSPVMAARSGTVADTGRNPVMGNFVLLEHSGGFTTFYGHLESVTVSLMDSVRSGMIIGTVGSTGITTGSHLHFEIRQDRDPRDPMRLLP